MVFDDLNGTPLDNKSKQQKNKNKIEASTLRPAVSTPSYIASVNQLCRTWKRRCFVATPDTLCYCRWGCCCTSVLKFTSIYLHDTLNRSVYIWMSYIPFHLKCREGGGERGCRAKSAPCGCLSKLQRPFSSSPVCELNVAGSLTSVKPTTTVSVCSLGLLQWQAQIRSIARSILLPDFNFACDKKKVTSKD